ncbi:MAG: T9SS type A sorting domain-containing protein [Bacteroidales bacterium]|nr:T9SS type A sorting domain-containing protein [Bacteroidales bacterium]
MKRILLTLVTLIAPFVMFAQIAQTSVVFEEDFDQSTVQMTTTSNHDQTNGDWHTDNTLHASGTSSFHTPVYSTSTNSSATTADIPLTDPNISNINHIYLSFDQICKVNNLDNATIYYSVAYGYNSDGDLNWSTWSQLVFTGSSPFYFGSGTYTGGKFNANCYSNWASSNNAAVPNNTWWHHEYFDLTSFIFQTGATHCKFQLRCNKVSPPSSGTDACAGWYIDNFKVILSNCELEHPTIQLTAPVYVNKNSNMLNNIGPYTIHATLFDNDTLNMDSVYCKYRINSGAWTTCTNNIVTNNLTTSGHTVTAQWDFPTICYYDTIYYRIHVNDVHGSAAQIDTPMIAWHNQSNIHNNDCALDSTNTFPHCFITGVDQPVTIYFKNKSDAEHSQSTGSPYQTALNVTLKVENENHVVTHTSSHSWTGSLCFDEPSSLSLGNFTPTHGFNYITVYVNTRNGQTDGNHANDTIKFTGYACDSLLHGDYTVGGTNPDFATMADVKAALTYCGIDGPTVFHFRPGTYQDFDFDENYIGQSATNTITFQGDNTNTVIITNNHNDSGVNLYGAVTLINVNNFIFRNLTLQGNNNAVSRGVVIRGNGSTNITFDACNITAFNTNSTANTSFAIGRSVASTQIPDTITIQNCNITGGNYGIYYYGSNARKNVLNITGNTVKSCYRGIYAYYSSSNISNNHVSQLNMSTHQNFSGIYVDYVSGADINGNTIDSTYDVEYGIYLRYATLADFYIRNNHVLVGDSKYGIDIENSSSTNAISGYVYNNEVILYPVTENASYAMQIKASNLLNVLNNSLFIKSDAPYSNTAALRIENNNNTYLDNNILINHVNCSDNTSYPLYLNANSTATGAYNNFYSTSGVVAYKTVARNTVAELEDAVATLTNGISLMPEIADPTSSLLPTSFTGFECPRISPVTKDIRNTDRSALTYMGAYADQIASTDASIVAMTNPALGACPQNTYNITVDIANKGAEALSFASHPATITVHSDTLNLNQTITVNSGNVAVLGTLSQVVANNVAVPVNQVVDFTFIITTNGDNNQANDTLRTMFVMEAAIPDYEEVFSNGTQQTWTIEQLNGAGNWSFQEGTGEYPEIAPVYGTGRLYFNSKNFSNATQSRAIMPVVQLANATNPILEMWFAHNNVSNKALEGVTVKISTDGGTTFTNLIPQGQTTALVKRYLNTATTPTWTLYTYDLSNYVSSGCVYIAFDAYAQAGNNINIDRIRLRSLYDNDLSVTNVYAQGETPSQYEMSGVVSALVRNEGYQAQSNAKVYLTVTGAAETYTDSLTIPSLASGAEVLVSFPDHQYNVNEVKNVEVRSRDDQHNVNNAQSWRMVTNTNIVNYADTSEVGLMTGDYTSIIRPCVRYKIAEPLCVTAVKYYYDQTYIANPSNGMRAFVSNADGEIVATSALVDFESLQQGAWNIIPIENFALTNMSDEFYVGIEMLSNGDYLCSQIESPLRDSTFFYLENGDYVPQPLGLFMIGAQVDTPYVKDMALLEVLNPTTRCDLGHENITIAITNNGFEDIPAGTVFHYSVNGLATVTDTMQTALASHATTEFAFPTIFDFTNSLVDIDSNYNVRVWIDHVTGDRLQFNDTIEVDIVSLGKANTPIVQDTVIVSYSTTGVLTGQLPSTITTGEIGWYANTGYESWELLAYTNNFTTPVIYFDTTFYATASPGFIFDTIVGEGTLTGTQPFMFTNAYSRGRMLYNEGEIGMHGPITSIGLYVNSASNANASDGIPIKLYMKTTDLTTFPTTAPFSWDDDINGATLVFDGRIYFNETGWYMIPLSQTFNYDSGNLIIFTETNCGDYCTGTGTQCDNCGPYVSGAASYPQFRMTNMGNGYVQYKNANTQNMTGNYTNYARRMNMRFKIANLECGSEKVPVHVHVPDIPTYDVQTMEMIYPTGGCAMAADEHIQVTIKNLLNQSIPANKVVVYATINGTTISHTVDEAFTPEELKTVTFTAPFDFTAPSANVTYNYTIYTDMPTETVVYRGNDTITGQLTSTYTAPLLTEYNYTGNYTQTIDILQPDDRLPSHVTQYYFYDDENATTQIHTTTNAMPYYTTPALYDSVTYWVAARTKISNCTTSRKPIHINVFRPQYDLITNSLEYPVSYQCGVANSPQLQVNVGNTDTTASSVIPSGTFNLTADFTGTNTATGTTSVNVPISSLQNATITFANGINIGSTTQNNSYTYNIYSNPANSMAVYRLNDTITGQLYVPANPVAPNALTYTATYGTPYTITPNSNVLDYFYFYENQNDNTPVGQGTSFTTDPIYSSPVVYYYSGRIEDDDFDTTLQIGTASTGQSYPFTFTNGHSYAKILYSASELGSAGRIDTLFFSVHTANTSGSTIPIKMWLKNHTTDIEQIATSATSINWNTETNAATLIFDGELGLDATSWFAIPIPGGFDYDGNALFLYVEHNCGDASCVTNNGINPVPKFHNSSIQKKVLYKAQNTALTSAASFALQNYRWNTRFKMNYTCESPKATITINTTIPQHDVGVTAINAPVTPSNTYTANNPVQVVVKNFGSQAASNFPVSYQLANGTPVTQNYTGNLAAGATATVNFTTTCDLTSVYYDTPFKAYTGLSSDTYHNNDTLTIMVRKEDPCISRPLSLATGADISNVTFAGINNGTGTPYTNYTPAGDGLYTDYTTTVAPGELVLGQSYQMAITHSFTTTATATVYKTVYIDYNRNGSFETNEQVFTSGAVAGGQANATTNTTITVPTTATLGLTRMRVICAAGNYTNACGTYNYAGETEDYAILMSPPVSTDMGIVNYIHPVGTVCQDGSATIRIRVRNYGSQAQTLSVDNPLALTVNVTGAATGTYTTSLTEGTYQPYEDIIMSISNVNLGAAGDYTLNATITYNGDLYLTNNTMAGTAHVDAGASAIPFLETFDSGTGSDGEYHFTTDWTLDQSAANYKWAVYQGASPNANTNGGPANDHTQDGTVFEQFGRYAAVQGINGSNNSTKWTTLTSKCLNLHYQNGYPAELSFYDYFTGPNTSNFVMTVEVGSGDNFIPVDTLTKEDGETGVWSRHVLALIGYDEVGQIRFRMTGQVNKIDPAIDDVNVTPGLPDLAVQQFVYPYDFNDADHQGECLQFTDTIHPIVRFYNNGDSPISEFDAMCEMAVGVVKDTIIEHVIAEIMPGESYDYEFVEGFVIPENVYYCQFAAFCIIDLDKDLTNNTKRVIPCTSLDIESYEAEQGVVLNQNMPNPAVDQTTIVYLLPDFGKTTLQVYSAMGQLLYTDAQDGVYGQNQYDIKTANLAAGVYYYTLTYKDVVLTKKMVIQK